MTCNDANEAPVIRLLASLLVVVIAVPAVAVISIPILLITSLADRDAYWTSFWWRLKNVMRTTADVAGIIGSSLP